MSTRDTIMALRDAFVAGVRAAHDDRVDGIRLRQSVGMYRYVDGDALSVLMGRVVWERAKKEYPMPRIIKPNVGSDPHGLPLMYAYINQRVQCKWTSGALVGRDWQDFPTSVVYTAERLALWAALAAKPTIEVEDDS